MCLQMILQIIHRLNTFKLKCNTNYSVVQTQIIAQYQLNNFDRQQVNRKHRSQVKLNE